MGLVMRDNIKYAFLYMVCSTVIAILFIMVSILFSGCRSQHQCMVMEKTITDSTVIRDTTYEVRLVPYNDSVSIRDTTSFLHNPYAYSYASYSNGLLNHSLKIYPFASVTVKVPYFIERTRRIEVPKPYPVEKKLTKWQSVKQDFGGYAIFSIIVTTLIVFGRFIYRLKKGG